MERFVVELFVRGVVLCLLAALALALLRRSAAAHRHLICVLALCSLLILPLAQRMLPPLLLLPPRPVAATEQRTVRPADSDRLASQTVSSDPSPAPEALQNQPEAAESSPPAPAHHASLSPGVTAHTAAHHADRFWKGAAVLWIVWGLGASTLLLRLTAALFRLRNLKAKSRAELIGGVPVWVGDRVRTPITWGIHRHIILLPSALLAGDPALCETAIRHEQAHIARWDWAWSLLAETVCAVCWFHPGAWWLRRRMRRESERACDDLVLLSGIAGPDYATHLLQILRSGSGAEIAPAMAHIGSMEERLRHILDTARPRRAGRIGLTLTANFGLCLLVLAMFRVSSRPADAQPPAERASPVEATGNASQSQVPSHPMLAPAEAGTPPSTGLPFAELPPMASNFGTPGLPNRAMMTSALPDPATLQNTPRQEAPAPGPAAPLTNVVWGKVVDGLEPGFLLGRPRLPNQRVPFNSEVAYQVLVRNATQEERVFQVQCQNHDEWDIPYLISSDDIVQALDGNEIPKKFRATGTSSPLTGLFPAYIVTLAPGEAVVVPEGLSLYIGTAEKKRFPRMEEIKAGMNWIVQPITVHAVTPEAIAEARATQSKITLSIVNRKGIAEQRSVARVPAQNGGKKLYAKIQLEVGTLNAEAVRNAGKAVWGKVDKGIQCGIRMLTPQRTFRVGDTLEAEILWRNSGNSPINAPHPGQLDLYPSIYDAAGHFVLIDFGARFDLIPIGTTFEPGEVQSLGVSRITLVPAGTPSPKSNMEPGHVTLAPGAYTLIGNGGVGAANPNSGAVEFQVVGKRVDPQKADGISWGEEREGYRYGLRITDRGSLLEVWVQNQTTNTQILHYTTWPPDLTGAYTVHDSADRTVPIPSASILQESRTAQMSLRPGEKARLYTQTMSALESGRASDEGARLTPGETYSVGWGSGHFRTGRVSFQAPVQNVLSWGSEWNGLRLGLRAPQGVDSFSKLTQARFEVLLTNRSGKPVKCGWMGYPTINEFSPALFTPKGKPILFKPTLAGPYTNQGSNLAPGETVVLGTIALPREEAAKLDAFPAGQYLAEFSLDVTLPDRREQLLKSRLQFAVGTFF